ncbi:MAG: T9SS type A sorting domain-containing protein [Bacteroidota bacterium]|nr:T9SS type A sorting domain-containing protein [Bacteroidota bacterium]
MYSEYPLFRNPWHVDPQQTTAWNVHQPNMFDRYQPLRSKDANGGMFIDLYDEVLPPIDYYSIRASKMMDGYTKQHKSGSLEVGDYAFLSWETMFADLFPDPKNEMWPPEPAYANPEEYDTKIVDFLDGNAMVNALYKKHRTSDRVEPPTGVNSQRKVALDAWDVYHAVYESNGQIWYTRSTDRGVTWSGEQRVSDRAQHAARPSIATMADAAWITYVADGEVHLRIAGNHGWESIYAAPVGMSADCTPAVAVLDDYTGATGWGPAICLVWEDMHELRFTLIQNRHMVVDNQMLVTGHASRSGVDQPRYPSIAASTEVPSLKARDHGFHIAWFEHGSVFYVKLAIDRRTDPVTLAGWGPGGAVAVETVHARTGSVGCVYPARHAPSIAVTEEGTVHVAFDVVNWYSPWPTNSRLSLPGGGSQVTSNGIFAVCERGLPSINGPTWQTTTTLIGGSSLSSLCSPTVGAKPPSIVRGSKSNALRVIYNDRQGQLRVARFDGALNLAFHAEGWDPSVTVWAPENDGLVDVYSYFAQPPYAWHMIASRNALAKQSDDRLVRMRQLLLSQEEAFAGLGLSAPRVWSEGGVRPIEWNEAHDSTMLGVNATVADKMRTATFTPTAESRLLLDVERFAVNPHETNAEFLLRVNDAESGEALRMISLPINTFTSAAAMAVQEIDLTSLSGTPVFISADFYCPDEQWVPAIVDRYAIAEETTDEELEKISPPSTARRAVLKQNHPNPFNPTTGISYHLPEAGEIRLAVYNLLGTEVAQLRGGWESAGDHTVHFDGAALPSGIYVYRLEHAGAVLTRSMHLLK